MKNMVAGFTVLLIWSAMILGFMVQAPEFVDLISGRVVQSRVIGQVVTK